MQKFSGILTRVLLNTLLVALAWFVAKQSFESFYVIPRSIVELSVVSMSAIELLAFLKISIVSSFVVLLLSYGFSMARSWCDEKALVIDTFFVALALTLSTSIYFTGTENSFSPNFAIQFMGIGLVMRLALVALISVLSGSLAGVFRATLKFAVSPVGLTSLLIMLMPGALLVGYKKDRRVANFIHKSRRYFSQSQRTPYFTKVASKVPFEQPIELELDAKGEMFLLERVGKVYSFDSETKTLLLDFTKVVGPPTQENGALGLALHPEFSNESSGHRGRLFVSYTHLEGDSLYNRISEFRIAIDENGRPRPSKLSLSGSEVSREKSSQSDSRGLEASIQEKILIEQKRGNDGYHNGGGLEFGPDGYLYIAMGEASDVKHHQQIDYALYSGILRIDVDNNPESLEIKNQPKVGKTSGYKIPADNPFAYEPTALHEFYAIGLRNPFRIRFDSKVGKLWAGEVGSIYFEEVNVIEPAGNYKFPYAEGDTASPRPADYIGKETKPHFFYRHTALNRAVIGGNVYRGSLYPKLTGQYVFGDNYSGRIMSIASESQPRGTEAKVLATLPHLGQMGLTSVRMHPDGNIYFTTLGKAGGPNGHVWMLTKDKAEETKVEMKLADSSMPPAKLFEQYCSRCHGLGGEGKKEVSAALKVEMANFQSSEWQKKREKAFLVQVITKGGAEMGLNAAMPPWGNILTSADIEKIAEYIKADLSR